AIMTREAFENVIRVNTAIGGSTNAPPHITAIARHAGIAMDIQDWQDQGFALPLLVNMQPAGKYLGESFQRAGGVPAVMGEMLAAGLLHGGAMTVSGKTVAENLGATRSADTDVIKTVAEPMRKDAGFVVLSGNLFNSALMKTSVISPDFQKRFLSKPGSEGVHEARAVVFEGPEDYHDRLNDPDLGIDENTILFIRNVGPVGYPGSAEVVNMQPPDALLKQGIAHLPTVGDGRQSGTSESPSILNASPESVVGGGLALLRTGDRVRLDIPNRRLDAVVPEDEWAARRAAWTPPELTNETPWQELYRRNVGQLSEGGCLEFATNYHRTSRVLPRDNH
ncbi:MAG TPA: dihydroxy-acid dehydratase, partial [Thermohalobaculum sp.]|nr:dihydroxy-acid dehydratase [Thermohalobaculum sp.]